MATCPFCKNKIKPKDAYIVWSKTGKTKKCYCDEECYKGINPSPRVLLTDYIQEYYIEQRFDKTLIPWKLITAQLKNIEKDKTFNDKGILYTLEYMVNIEGMNLLQNSENESVLNLVEFYYIQAKEYYKQTKEIENAIEDFNFDEEKTVTIKSCFNKNRLKYKEENFD